MSSPSQLIQNLDAFRRSNVLCIGDVMLDRFIYGQVDRISPEAPIPVMDIQHEIDMPGSAGNVVRNVAGLGGNATLVSVIGQDGAGKRLSAMMAETPELTTILIEDEGRPTSIKTRYIAGSQQLLRADEESRVPLSTEVRRKILDAVGEQVSQCGAVILSDYGKGVLADGIAVEIIQSATAAGRPVVVDPSGTNYEIYRGATLVTPNRKELSEATRMPVETVEEVEAAARYLIENHGIGSVLATLSADGMLLVHGEGSSVALSAEAREVFDVSGAGDTVVAALSLALATQLDLSDGAELANTAAGIVVGKVGTAVANAEDVASILKHRDLATGEAKIMELPSAAKEVGRWRQQGLRTGFTNGCFDLLHPGHISALHQARMACDKLVVGLNSDSSTKRLKGPERPVQSELARAAVLASMIDVDLVVIFEEDTPSKLLEVLQPELFVKGADYRIEDIPEAKIVQAYGGEILLAELEEGHSTTATIARLSN